MGDLFDYGKTTSVHPRRGISRSTLRVNSNLRKHAAVRSGCSFCHSSYFCKCVQFSPERQGPGCLMSIIQVSHYLSPTDLLSLYRANKQWRAALDRSPSTWRSSIAAVGGIPACPPWISEPYYTALWFDTYCERCNRSDIPTEVLWQVPARYCMECKYAWYVFQNA